MDLSITVKDRDKIWAEVKLMLAKEKNERISNVGLKPTVETVKKIKDIMDWYDGLYHEWDIFLHCGKTESQETMNEMDKKRNDLVSDFVDAMFGGK